MLYLCYAGGTEAQTGGTAAQTAGTAARLHSLAARRHGDTAAQWRHTGGTTGGTCATGGTDWRHGGGGTLAENRTLPHWSQCSPVLARGDRRSIMLWAVELNRGRDGTVGELAQMEELKDLHGRTGQYGKRGMHGWNREKKLMEHLILRAAFLLEPFPTDPLP
eukprot:gene14953-biopygen13471